MNVIVVKVGEPIINVFNVSKIEFTDGTYFLTTLDDVYSFNSSDYHIIIN